MRLKVCLIVAVYYSKGAEGDRFCEMEEALLCLISQGSAMVSCIPCFIDDMVGELHCICTITSIADLTRCQANLFDDKGSFTSVGRTVEIDEIEEGLWILLWILRMPCFFLSGKSCDLVLIVTLWPSAL